MHAFCAPVLATSLLFSLPSARAQVVLSSGKEAQAKPGNVAPHLVCTVCGERSYNLRDDGRRDEQGRVIAWCARCKRDTSMRRPDPPASGKASGKGGRLVLPAPAQPEPAPPPAQTRPGSAPKESWVVPPGKSGPADFIFSEVSRQKRIDDDLAQRAVESLIALGADGLDAARRNLAAEESPALLVAARVLLRSGRPEDADLVRDRLRAPLPVTAGAPLLELLATVDPVRASPAFLAELLDHPHAGVRAAAQKRLTAFARSDAYVSRSDASGARSDASVSRSDASVSRSDASGTDLLPLLERALASKRAETRRRALEIAAGLDGPAATEVLLARVADPSATVAAAVASALSTREDPDLDARLLGLAFRERWILRPGACALLAIVEREDRSLRPLLDETRVEPLLSGMQSSDPFLSGACAAALAGIGFRVRGVSATPWLDRDVVDRLVAAVSGQRFHNDLPALSEPALRRLELLTGAGLGSDGPRWVEWWVKAREGFIARRAWFEITAEDAPLVCVRYAERGAKAQEFELLGPAAETAPAADRESVRLSESEARALVAALEREGLLGPERLPGLRGLRGEGERTFEVMLDAAGRARAKSFTFGPGKTEPWFDRAASLAREILDRNRWQRYPDPARHASSRELWQEQAGWWADEHTDLERALRMKALVLAALPRIAATGSPERRDQAVEEIERLYREAGTAEPADFPYLAQALSAEPFWAERAHRLLDLALASARARPTTGAEATSISGAEATSIPGAKATSVPGAEATGISGAEATGTPGAEPTSIPATEASESGAAKATGIGTPAAPTIGAGESPTIGAKAALDGATEPLADRHVPTEQGKRLVDLLVEKFPTAAPEELPRIFAACEAGFASTLAGDPRPAVRAAAARALSKGPSPAEPETVATLLRLLGDHDPSVEAAAVEALGARGVEAARTELLVRARLGLSDVRAAALRAVGHLRGDLVLDALSLAAADTDPKVRLAAAWGLADMRDPAAAPLLIGMLGAGEGSPEAEAARAGLLALGPAAWDQLLRVVHSESHRSRREAALLLSRQGVPESAPVLLALLSASPQDAHLASELAVLTGCDLRAEPDPAQAWWGWWDGVVHGDSMAWFLSALSRAGESPPARAGFEGSGSREARLFLVEVLARREAHLVERARRELARMLGRDVGAAPPRGTARDAWIAGLRESVLGQGER